MSRGRRVAVTAPTTGGTGRRRPAAAAAAASPEVLAVARRIRRAQLRRAAAFLLVGALLLLGLPVLVHTWGSLAGLRLLGVPGAWLVVAVFPYPIMAGLAWAQLLAAERVERPDDS